MSDARHRGPDPRDRALFVPALVPALQAAVAELGWLLTRGYSERAAIELVGDRHQLPARARLAVRRMAAAEDAVAARRGRRIALAAVRGRPLTIDGFNALVTCESALAGGLLLRGRDGALRDLGSVHGGYRDVDETAAAIAALADVVAAAGPASVRWLLDRPVSNSGRLAALLRAAAPASLAWTVELIDAPDPALAEAGGVIATSDSWILDRCESWIDLPAAVVAARGLEVWLIDAG